MKPIKTTQTILFALAIAVAAVGCKTKSPSITKLPESPTGSATATTTPSNIGDGKALADDANKPSSQELANPAIMDPDKRKDWPRDREIFKSDTVHFDYDSSTLKSEDKAKLAAVAEYLKAHATDAVEIEGHCDERGTEEYNRSLGERRALALREELIRLGVSPSRVDTLSFGEDRPAETGHNEASYRKNRRGEFILEKSQNLVGLNASL
jgi:peptidoglycan-associated lipoprotein